MKILNFAESNFTEDTFLIPVTETKELKSKVHHDVECIFKIAVDNNIFNGKYFEIYRTSIMINSNIKNCIFLGLGDMSKLTNREIFLSFSKAFSECKKINSKNTSVYLDNIYSEKLKDEVLIKICESAYLTNYKFGKYKSDFKNIGFENINIILNHEGMNNIIEQAQACSAGTTAARDLTNEPALYMTPEQLANEVVKLGNEYGFQVNVLDKNEITDNSMDAFLAVAKGSVNTPKLIVMKYFGNKLSNEKICLVGKGITFDSGGYSLKNVSRLPTMYGDMGGAASVIGAMVAVSKTKLEKNVVAIVPACENRISSDSYLPGDVLKTMNGRTVEVISTDAEGRLVLADAITYGIKTENPDLIIDIATLTGGASQALGNKTAAMLTNDKNICEVAKEASEKSCEKIWELPLDKELRPAINSRIADIKNSSVDNNPGGSTILGALFLENFVENKPWMHIDMANVNWTKEDLSYCVKGATGYGVSLLYNMVKLL